MFYYVEYIFFFFKNLKCCSIVSYKNHNNNCLIYLFERSRCFAIQTDVNPCFLQFFFTLRIFDFVC